MLQHEEGEMRRRCRCTDWSERGERGEEERGEGREGAQGGEKEEEKLKEEEEEENSSAGFQSVSQDFPSVNPHLGPLRETG